MNGTRHTGHDAFNFWWGMMVPDFLPRLWVAHSVRQVFRVPQANIEARSRRALARVALCRLSDTWWTGVIRPIWSTLTHVMVESTQTVVGTGTRILFTRGTCSRYSGTRGHFLVGRKFLGVWTRSLG